MTLWRALENLFISHRRGTVGHDFQLYAAA